MLLRNRKAPKKLLKMEKTRNEEVKYKSALLFDDDDFDTYQVRD